MRYYTVCIQAATPSPTLLNTKVCTPVCDKVENYFAYNHLIPCTQPIAGRYVIIQHKSNNIEMTICELEVLSVKRELRRENFVQIS